jgi:tetratricopeptide (TPR) repeat protein
MKKYFSIVLFLTAFLLSSCKGDNKQGTQQKTTVQQKNNIDFEQLISEGQEYLKNMQVNKAKEVFLKAIDVSPDKPDGYYGLGVCYTINCGANIENCKEGIKYLDKVLQMDAKYRRAYYNRAICRDKLGNSQGAIDDLDIQISLDNTDPDYYHNRAVIKLQLGDTTDACNDFKKSYDLGNVFDKVSIENLCN